jgi:CheY-like chemotaxis protein/transcriptional regulator with XRE-family HTH domain
MAVRHSQFTEIVKAFGKAVRIFRLKNGCSQETLADKAKLDRSYMSQIERGIKNATLNSIWTISSALEIKPSELLDATEKLMAAGANESPSAELKIVETGEPGPSNLQHTKQSLTLGGSHGTPPIVAPHKSTILVVDDDKEVCSSIGNMLKEAGFEICTASSGMEAVHLLSTQSHIKAIVSDVRMSNGNGFELLEMVRNYFPNIPLFFITGYDDLSEEDAIRKGAQGLFNKPCDGAALVTRVRSSLESMDPTH